MRDRDSASEREKRARGEMMSVAYAREAGEARRSGQLPGERYRPWGDNAVYTPRGSGCSRPRRPSSPRPVTIRPSRYRPPTAAWQPSLGELRAPPPGARAGCSALQGGPPAGAGRVCIPITPKNLRLPVPAALGPEEGQGAACGVEGSVSCFRVFPVVCDCLPHGVGEGGPAGFAEGGSWPGW